MTLKINIFSRIESFVDTFTLFFEAKAHQQKLLIFRFTINNKIPQISIKKTNVDILENMGNLCI